MSSRLSNNEPMKRKYDEKQMVLFDAPLTENEYAGEPVVLESESTFRPGFKKVKHIGWMPEDWDCIRIGQVLKEVGRYVKWDDEQLYHLVSVRRRSEGIFDRNSLYGRQIKTKSLKVIKVGDFLISRMQVVHGGAALVTEEFDGKHASTTYSTLVTKDPEKLNINFFSWLACIPEMYHKAYLSSNGVHIEKMTFSLRDYLRQWISVPTDIGEQGKIAHILDTWAQAEIQLDQLINLKQKRLRGLMQKLLFEKLRFLEFNEQPWREVRIGEILKEVRRPSKLEASESVRLISVRRRSEGLFIRESNEIQGNLKVVQKDDFVISRRQVVHGASGLAGAEHHGACVSNSYSVLVSRDLETLYIRFFNWLSKTPELYHIAYLSSYGVHIEKLIFHLRFYFKHKVCIPQTVEEQRRIAAVLDTAKAEIDLLRQERSVLAEQKKGLMQLLLTGEKRVTPDPEDYEHPNT